MRKTIFCTCKRTHLLYPLLYLEPVDLVLDAALVQQLLLVDAHQRVPVDAGVQHVIRVHGILLPQRLENN